MANATANAPQSGQNKIRERPTKMAGIENVRGVSKHLYLRRRVDIKDKTQARITKRTTTIKNAHVRPCPSIY